MSYFIQDLVVNRNPASVLPKVVFAVFLKVEKHAVIEKLCIKFVYKIYKIMLMIQESFPVAQILQFFMTIGCIALANSTGLYDIPVIHTAQLEKANKNRCAHTHCIKVKRLRKRHCTGQ